MIDLFNFPSVSKRCCPRS